MADNTINDYAQLIGKIEKEFTTTKAKEQVGSSSQVDFADVLDNAEDDPLPVNGFYWAVNLAGPFLLGR